MRQNAPRVQCFAKRSFSPMFTGENDPRLAYVSKIPLDLEPVQFRVMHAHQDLVEILLIYSGASEILLGDKKQTIQAGDLLIYNSGVVHDEWSWRENGVGHYCAGVSGLRMPGLRENALIPDGQSCIFPTGGSFEEIRALFELMYGALSAEEPQAEPLCHHLLRALLVRALSLAGGAEAAPVDPPDILGRRIQNYIDAHYTEPLTLQSIGDALRVSPYYLSHVFKKTLGYSPMQYLLRRRIGEAQTLLLTTRLPVGQIAEMVGYDTQSYFNSQFTKQVGMAPGRYRQEFAGPEAGSGKNGNQR